MPKRSRSSACVLLANQFLVLNNGVSSFLLAVGKQGRGAIIAGGCVILDVIIAAVLVRRGYGLLAVAWAALAAYALFTLANLVYVHSHFPTSLRDRLLFLIRAVLPVVYLGAVLWFVDQRFVRPSWPWGVAAAVALSWVMLAPLAWWAGRLLGRVEGSFAQVLP